ncbi:MAG: 23S rRNA (adenine(2503)-C(2))-methyltransferase RlmN [Nitrospirota bacterium]|jgi:23S rRNA (adenine2503-C2)-methyltransferase
MGKVNLKEFTAEELRGYISRMGLPRFRADQLLHWMYERRASSLGDVTEFSKDLRTELSGVAYLGGLEISERAESSDGTEKFLFDLQDGHGIESVLIPDDDRLTLCVSSQAGCAMGCRFCLTGRGGLKRNLRAFEIAEQVIAVQRLSARRITNVVLMGMGEPLNNLKEVAEALWRLTGLMGYSPRRITLSTCGLPEKLLELPTKAPPVNIAVSLNATTDEQRDYIMPVNKRFPIDRLIEACRRYPLQRRRRITFEYVLIEGFNDSSDDAHRLAGIARRVPSKVNLIPVNEFEGSEFRRPSEGRVLEFQKVLVDSGVTAIIRKSKGADVLAACGQLSASRKD